MCISQQHYQIWVFLRGRLLSSIEFYWLLLKKHVLILTISLVPSPFPFPWQHVDWLSQLHIQKYRNVLLTWHIVGPTFSWGGKLRNVFVGCSLVLFTEIAFTVIPSHRNNRLWTFRYIRWNILYYRVLCFRLLSHLSITNCHLLCLKMSVYCLSVC